MKMSLFLLSLTLLLSSCLKQTESIDPMATTMTVAQIQREAMIKVAEEAGNSELSNEAKATLELSSDPRVFYLTVKYNLKNIDVFQVASMPNIFLELSHSFLQTMAKVILAIAGPRNIDINDINFTVPSSFNIDNSLVKSLQIKKIFLTYNKELDERSDYAANFSFINTLEISREIKNSKLGTLNSLFLSYRKSRNLCLYKCLQFEILEDNIIDLLKPETVIKLKPSLSIGALPPINELALDGQIELKIGLMLPF